MAGFCINCKISKEGQSEWRFKLLIIFGDWEGSEGEREEGGKTTLTQYELINN